MNFYRKGLNHIGPVLIFIFIYLACVKAFMVSCEEFEITKLFARIFVFISIAHSVFILGLTVLEKVDGEGILNTYTFAMFIFGFVYFGFGTGDFAYTVLLTAVGSALAFFQFMVIYSLIILVLECFVGKYSEAYNL